MKRILLVDDDETFRPLLAGLLRNEFEVVETSGVNDALKMLASIPVDLICSDYNMQDGTGIDLLQSCRQKHFSIPFILMSANDGNGLSRKVDLYGITFCEKQTQTFALLPEKCCYQKTTGRTVQMRIDDWNFDKERYIYIQLAHKIESAIFSKELNAGDTIPSIRKMAEILRLNPYTVMRAY